MYYIIFFNKIFYIFVNFKLRIYIFFNFIIFLLLFLISNKYINHYYEIIKIKKSRQKYR